MFSSTCYDYQMQKILALALVALLTLTTLFGVSASAQDSGPTFPRLAMWHPGHLRHSYGEWTRYDLMIGNFNTYVKHDPRYGALSSAVRKHNPDAKLMTYFTNSVIRHASLANELQIYDGYMGDWPDKWFLTEAGTTLKGGINATQTKIPVNKWTQSGPVKGLNKPNWTIFREGYDVICDGEIMRIVGLDKNKQTITVVRGISGTTAGAHGNNLRIAPILRFWAGSYMMNLTDSCPKAQIHGAVRAENWAAYSFRISKMGVIPWFWNIGGDQDGFLFDLMADEISWTMWSIARSVDLNQDNISDEFDELDADWMAGIDYTTGLFHRQFPGAPIIRNNSRSIRFPLYDGENFENWPTFRWDEWDVSASARKVGLTKYWHRYFFGEILDEGDPMVERVNRVEVGGIVEFEEFGKQPNYTLLSSAEFETDLDVHGRPEYRRKGIDGKPLDDKVFSTNTPAHLIDWINLFEPDYQKMRWGLCSALVSGTYYCYIIHSDGHGMLGLRWFDEYDDAGAGRGYLGYPTGEITQLAKQKGNSDWGVWGREYSGGYVIVNPLGKDTKVKLPPGKWQRIKGTQQPKVNTGAIEEGSVTVPKYDGLILKRVR